MIVPPPPRLLDFYSSSEALLSRVLLSMAATLLPTVGVTSVDSPWPSLSRHLLGTL